MLDRELYFDFYHSVNGFEKIVVNRIHLSRADLGRRDKTRAIIDWLLSPFYVYAWNLAFKHLGQMTKKECNDMNDYLDAMSTAGLPADEENEALLVYEPAFYLGRRFSYQRISRFLDFLYSHRHAIAVQLYKYAHDPKVVPGAEWANYEEHKHQRKMEKAYRIVYGSDNKKSSEPDLPF